MRCSPIRRKRIATISTGPLWTICGSSRESVPTSSEQKSPTHGSSKPTSLLTEGATMRSWFISIAGGSLILLALFATPGAVQQRPPANASPDWPMYRHDFAGTGWSPLTQIDAGNVARLGQAWDYALQSDTPSTGRGAGGPNSEATPIVINGTMYVPAANRVVALDPQSGQERWRYVVTGGAPSRRGVAFWGGDGTLPARIFVAAGRRLIALNAASGAPDPRFGTNGEIDMVVPYNSVPLIY